MAAPSLRARATPAWRAPSTLAPSALNSRRRLAALGLVRPELRWRGFKRGGPRPAPHKTPRERGRPLSRAFACLLVLFLCFAGSPAIPNPPRRAIEDSGPSGSTSRSVNPTGRNFSEKTLRLSWLLPWLMGERALGASAKSKNTQTAADPRLTDLHSKLARQLEHTAAQFAGVMGLAGKDLTTGESFTVNAAIVFPQASSIKITG